MWDVVDILSDCFLFVSVCRGQIGGGGGGLHFR